LQILEQDIIYEQPGVTLAQADMDRLAAAGKFDVVRITKDQCDFYIEYVNQPYSAQVTRLALWTYFEERMDG